MATDLYVSILAPEELIYRFGSIMDDRVQLLITGDEPMTEEEILMVIDDKGITPEMERIIRLAESKYHGISVVELSVAEVEALLGVACDQP